MIKRATSFILVFLLVPQLLAAQGAFCTVFGGEYYEEGIKVTELKNGNFVFVGNTGSFEFGTYVACFNSHGEMLWGKSFGYKGLNISKKVTNVIQASDGYLYVAQNADFEPMYTKFDEAGNIQYDTFYRLPHKIDMGYLDYIIDDSEDSTIASIGGGQYSGNSAMYFQKTRYDGGRVSFNYLDSTLHFWPLGIFKTWEQRGYTIVGNGEDNKKYLLFVDSMGNYLSHRYLFKATNTFSFCRNPQGEFVFLNWKSLGLKTGEVVVYSEKGDSLKGRLFNGEANLGRIMSLDSSGYCIVGIGLTYLDSSLQVLTKEDSILHQTDSLYDAYYYEDRILASDGSIVEAGNYYKQPRNTLSNPRDFIIIKFGHDVTVPQNIRFMRTGLLEGDKAQHNARLYPNPASNRFFVNDIPAAVSCRLFNSTGQKSLTAFTDERGVDVSALPVGVYLSEVLNSSGEVLYRGHLLINRD